MKYNPPILILAGLMLLWLGFAIGKSVISEHADIAKYAEEAEIVDTLQELLHRAVELERDIRDNYSPSNSRRSVSSASDMSEELQRAHRNEYSSRLIAWERHIQEAEVLSNSLQLLTRDIDGGEGLGRSLRQYAQSAVAFWEAERRLRDREWCDWFHRNRYLCIAEKGDINKYRLERDSHLLDLATRGRRLEETLNLQ